jgi:hypothetical protein
MFTQVTSKQIAEHKDNKNSNNKNKTTCLSHKIICTYQRHFIPAEEESRIGGLGEVRDSGRYDVSSPGVRGSVRAMSKYKMYACMCM